MRLFVGDDWAQDHHDVELMDAMGRVLARRRLPEGVPGHIAGSPTDRAAAGRGR